ncbi:MAG TPA: NYN domain-containing protein [Candidatus Staskawiczbacteria bacterium]|nr:NYN domain-containing protein [Candidatus Staskawiczbacteria bacterium]
MFAPATEKIRVLAEKNLERISELNQIFNNKTNVYIDYANIRPWSTKLGWHIDIKRLKQFLYSFDKINLINFYNGTIIGNPESEQFYNDVKKIYKDGAKTKAVKVMKLSIDASSISSNSPALLKDFIRKPLLAKFSLETIEYLNNKLRELNRNGIVFIEDLKCNFDVEIGRDMLLDYEKNNIENFILWSGDSDFADPINQLLEDHKKVAIFGTSRRVASELNNLRSKGLFIFDIQKIRNFICWDKERQF